jgi:hypothetical protein
MVIRLVIKGGVAAVFVTNGKSNLWIGKRKTLFIEMALREPFRVGQTSLWNEDSRGNHVIL